MDKPGIRPGIGKIIEIPNLLKEEESKGRDLTYGSLFELVQLLTTGALEEGFDNVKKIPRNKLVNLLNYLNFSEGEFLVVFQHPQYQELILRAIKPNPCQEGIISGRWISPEAIGESLKDFEVLCFLIENNREIFLARTRRVEIDAQGIELTLPEFAFEIIIRKTNRYPCQHIRAEMIQDGILFPARLDSFSVNAFQVEIFSREGISLKWINSEFPVQIIFKEGEEIYYSRECKIVKQRENLYTKTLVLQPSHESIHRFKRREFRAPRPTLHPSPAVYYLHPLIKKSFKLTICDLSTSGFSVEEEGESSTLLPGMIIPNLQIELAGTATLSCKVQVIYQKTMEERIVKTGFTILNMSNEDYIRLTNLVNKSMNVNLDICGSIEQDSLWQFFFQAGFIYPQKYQYIQQNKEDFKNLYRKIYQNPTEIERHVTYQERGTLLGHISMLHVYGATWMLHHFMTTPSSRHKKVALTLLQQIEQYIIDSHYLESTRMDNIICYFRPENKFPNLVFGGAARALKDPKICSLDRFAYLSYPMIPDPHQGGLPEPWTMAPTGPNDLDELAHFYNHTSGGQMIQALDLHPGVLEDDRLTLTYHRLGFKRERYLYSIKKKGKVKAVMSLIKTDIGLNLSELTNGVTLFVLDPENFPFEVFLRAFSQLKAYDERQLIPVLIYPSQYAERQALACDRFYDLWIFGVENSDYYFSYVNKLFSRFLS
ncbi:MAG: GNAT family N-acetyltransferase [Deltaproteobacteria bacterium]|nr:GNAT family N-acetyltransferase [Deltaproteobacteria bacterium]